MSLARFAMFSLKDFLWKGLNFCLIFGVFGACSGMKLFFESVDPKALIWIVSEGKSGHKFANTVGPINFWGCWNSFSPSRMLVSMSWIVLVRCSTALWFSVVVAPEFFASVDFFIWAVTLWLSRLSTSETFFKVSTSCKLWSRCFVISNLDFTKFPCFGLAFD